MKLFKSFRDIKCSSSVVAIGNFDGIHVGHKKIFFELKRISVLHNVKSILILFEPQTNEFFHDNVVRLSSLRDKIIEIKKFDLDYVLCLNFKYFFACTARVFLNYLLQYLNLKFFVVSKDFKFGYKGYGDIKFLIKMSYILNYHVIKLKSVYVDNILVSSTYIRSLLFKYKFNSICKFLGRYYSICSKVIHGNRLATIINYPTINLNLFFKNIFLKGVFFVAIRLNHNLFLNDVFFGVAYIGKNFLNDNKIVFEIYIFDFNYQIYGIYVNVFFLKRIRDVCKLYSFNELKRYIINDIYFCKNLVFNYKKKFHNF